ncbi:hypothetical protein EXN66_Car014264 [Channa argus]|uniref:Uncharacterized protein n=1 Tax=Channa argus TaxID=215402 RepID=A0A6G1Q7U2_CHAAH|nr:hypothetical protein EXN66_Car014264 [Channa argus]
MMLKPRCPSNDTSQRQRRDFTVSPQRPQQQHTFAKQLNVWSKVPGDLSLTLSSPSPEVCPGKKTSLVSELISGILVSAWRNAGKKD